MYERAAWTIAFALVLYYINHQEYPGPALTLTFVIVLIGLVMGAVGYGIAWLRGPGTQRVIELVLAGLDLKGTERILDAGSEGGQLGLAAARKLTSGKVIALGDMAGNEAAREIARNEGLADRIRFEPADWKRLPYPDGNFDCVIGSGLLGRLGTESQRKSAVHELCRVLKPGGTLILHEISDLSALRRLLTEESLPPSLHDTSLPFGLGGGIVSARRPS